MKIYIAAAYATRDAVREEIVPLLESAGHEVISSWLAEGHELSPGTMGTAPVMDDEYATHHANNDIQEVLEADVLLALTDDWCRAYLVEWDQALLRPSGGRHVEMGVALGGGKYVVVLGDHENIFQRGLCLQARDVQGALEAFRLVSAL